MKYTIQGGVERPFLARFRSARFVLPLLVILAGLSAFAFGPARTKHPVPLTLGIYTVQTPNGHSGSSGGGKGGSGGGNSSTTGAQAQPLSQPSGLNQSTAITPATGAMTAGVVGGKGGLGMPSASLPAPSSGCLCSTVNGAVQGTESTVTQAPSTLPAPPPPPPTTPLTNTLNSAPQPVSNVTQSVTDTASGLGL